MRVSLRPALGVVVVVAAVLGDSAPAAPASLERRIYHSFVAGDYAGAAEILEQYLAEAPHDPEMLYNAACAYSRLRQRDRAASYLVRAVDAGLQDLDQIVRDPDLEALRHHPVYRAVVQRLQRAAGSRATEAIDRWRDIYGDAHYHYDRDEQRRIAYATALDTTSHREMRRMIERQTDHLLATLFAPSPPSYLLIAVPTPQDGRRLFNDDRTGGIYEHERRRLIARDIGSSLRHELVHALHYSHMDRLKQRHPLWVQEGLATLYEDYVLGEDDSIEFVGNDRHNIVRRLAMTGRLIRWRDLFKLSDDQFMARASELYPQVRSIFEFVAHRRRLAGWYGALIENFGQDRTGARAFETCFDLPLEEVEHAWRTWMRSRPRIDTTIELGDAALGIETQLNSSNDGVLITRVLPRSAAAGGDLKAGDVIVAVNGQPTRSLLELRTAIASRQVGDTVAIRARRDGSYFTVVVSLRPLEPMMW